MNANDKNKKTLVCLMGPTGSGKTDLALELASRFPFEIISVDSAMVYQNMDIGTAKPSKAILETFPHHLVDIKDPSETYSAGEFCKDAQNLIDTIFKKGRYPLLVGGTSMYFNALQRGLANMPPSDEKVRENLSKDMQTQGLSKLHERLLKIDPEAGKRIHPNDAQRIQRALEVYELTGKPITLWQKNHTQAPLDYHFINIALLPENRNALHARIQKRFETMLTLGFIDEVKALYERGDLHKDLPSMRSVGYRQAWEYLEGNDDKQTMKEKAIAATRQLAKRQITWLRSWESLNTLACEDNTLIQKANALLALIL